MLAPLLLLAAVVQADLHLDTPSMMVERGLPFDAPAGLEAGLPQLRAGGTNLAVEVLWPRRHGDHLARTRLLARRVGQEVERLDDLVLVRSPAEARAAAEAGRIGVVLALEGAHGLGPGPWRPVLDELQAQGLAILGLTWSISNRFAGSSGDGGGGLTPEGRALVDHARRKGLLIDLSHASRATTLEVCRTSPVPVIASHSDAWALQPVARNLTDEEIRCIAATGGVIGVNFHAPFLGRTRDVAAVADHVEHVARIGGRAVVALGSDFDGFIRPPEGLPDASALPRLWEELRRRGWSEGDLAGLRGENFLRAWQAALAHAGAAGEVSAPGGGARPPAERPAPEPGSPAGGPGSARAGPP